MDNRIRFDIADNQFTLDFAEEVKAEDLSLKVIRNDDPSLDIAWNEKDEQFHWINSGPNLLFSLLYPKRAVTGTAKFYLNPGLANFLKKVPQNVVYEIQIFNGRKIIAFSRTNAVKISKDVETASSKKMSAKGICAVIDVMLNDENDSVKNVFADPAPSAENFSAAETGTAEEPAPEKQKFSRSEFSGEPAVAENFSAEPVYEHDRQKQLESFFYGIDPDDQGRIISDRWMKTAFAAGIAIGIAVIAAVACNYAFGGASSSRDSLLDLFLNLLPRAGTDGQTSEVISFFWVILTALIYLTALCFKCRIVLKENRRRTKEINSRLFIEIKNNKNRFRETADQALSDLVTKSRMHFLNLFAGSLIAYKCGNSVAYGCRDSAADYFNEETVGSSHLHYSRMIMPAVLTAVGVLGTFVGLLLSLTSLRDYGIGADSAEMIPQIKELIKGASTAFITSIWGVFFSIVYTFIISWAKHSSSRTIKNLQENIDSVFCPYLGSDEKESVQSAINRLGARIDRNSAVMAERIAKAITAYVADVNDHTVGIVKDVVNEFQKRLLEILGKQSRELEAAAGKLVRAHDDAAEHVKQKYEQWELQHKTLIDEVQKEFGTIQRDADSYASKLQNLGDSFARMNKSFDNFSAMYQQMLSAASGNQEIMSGFVKEINQRIDRLNELFSESARFQEQLAGNTALFREFINNQNTYQKDMDQIITRLGESNIQIAKFRDGLTLNLQQEYRRIQEQIRNSSEHNTELMRHNIDELNRCWIEVVRDNMERLKDAFGNLARISGGEHVREAGTSGKKQN